MGILAKSIAPQSSYAAKKTDLWPDLMARLTDCVLPAQVDSLEQHIASLGLQIPETWRASIAELVEKRRAEIAEEDISEIMRDRFDF